MAHRPIKITVALFLGCSMFDQFEISTASLLRGKTDDGLPKAALTPTPSNRLLEGLEGSDPIIDGYELVGQRNCHDRNGWLYDSIPFDGSEPSTCAASCDAYLLSAPESYNAFQSFVGFETNTPSNDCYCLFDFDRNLDPELRDEEGGMGPIVTSSGPSSFPGNADDRCYRYVAFGTAAPTPAPSS